MKHYRRDIPKCLRCPLLAWSNTLQRWYCSQLGMSTRIETDRIHAKCPLPDKNEKERDDEHETNQ